MIIIILNFFGKIFFFFFLSVFLFKFHLLQLMFLIYRLFLQFKIWYEIIWPKRSLTILKWSLRSLRSIACIRVVSLPASNFLVVIPPTVVHHQFEIVVIVNGHTNIVVIFNELLEGDFFVSSFRIIGLINLSSRLIFRQWIKK